MFKKILLLLVIYLMAPVSYADFPLSQSIDKTYKDVPLKFELEKIQTDKLSTKPITRLWIWGTVENLGDKTYRNVEVLITAKDKSGNFINRKSYLLTPGDYENIIKPGHVGYLNGRGDNVFLDCEQVPYSIEYKVIGETD